MKKLRVWAPFIGTVEATLNRRARIPLLRTNNGWWETEEEYPAGTLYSFHLDGAEALPDPRSLFQPQGPHGPSEVVTFEEHRWTESNTQAPPLAGGLIYELHVGTFTEQGTLRAACRRLSYLRGLGVTHVELLPLAEFSGKRGWGYDGVLLYAVHHAYGGPGELRNFVQECHSHGMGVILDVVYNHLGPSGNYLSRFGPYFTERFHTPWGEAINFDDRQSDEVRRFVIDNALMWLRDYHIDGLRIDAVHAIFDMSAKHILAELAEEVEELSAHLNRHLFLIAESDLNDPRIIKPRAANGYGINAQWSDDFHHALHTVLTKEQSGYYADFGSLPQLAAALKQGYVYTGQYSPSRERRHGAPPQGLSGRSFVVFLQNHDQIGNRADGSRTSMLISKERLEIGAAILFCSPFIPMLFQGEEWGASSPFQYFTDYTEPELARAVSEGRRREFAAFGWNPKDIPDPQDIETFNRSKLRWEERENYPHSELLAWHKALIRLRREEPSLTRGDPESVKVSFDEEAQWLVLYRDSLCCAVNLADTAQAVPLEYSIESLLLASNSSVLPAKQSVQLPQESAAILRLSPVSN